MSPKKRPSTDQSLTGRYLRSEPSTARIEFEKLVKCLECPAFYKESVGHKCKKKHKVRRN